MNFPQTQRANAAVFTAVLLRAFKRTSIVISLYAVSALVHAQTANAQNNAEPLPAIAWNDNRHAAGHLSGNVLLVELETRMGVWYPEGAGKTGLTVAAFAEAGKQMQNPGPLIRVQQGTCVFVSVRNTLAKPLTMRGLGTERSTTGDSVVIAPGATHEFQFVAAAPGTYYYAGSTGRAPLLSRGEEDSQLNGAIVIDPPRTKVSSTDRVFVISWWYMLNQASPNGLRQVSMSINGRSWPHTEAISAVQGDSLRWHWINMTLLNHPMHLHGFYFRVDGVGNGAKYDTYAESDRRQAVTELLRPGATMALAWSPNRPGNWIFHCHVATHMSHLVSIGTVNGVPAAAEHDHATADSSAQTGMAHAMAGLVLGVRVSPRGKSPPPAREYRPLRLTISSKPNMFGAHAGYRYSLGETPSVSDSTSFGTAGPTLVLQQHQPVAITVVNRSQEAAAVHWHGIELESFPDGVPGWSGSGSTLLPAIAPGDSLVVRFTPHREGTFMYHSHFNERQQIASGLSGAIVVLAPGTQWQPDTDRVMLLSDNGPTDNIIAGPYPAMRLNGQLVGETMELRAGVTYRLRFINIRTDYTMNVALRAAVWPMQWRVIAKDGADLPAKQAVTGAAQLTFGPGEIYDVEFTPTIPGEYNLNFKLSEQAPPGTPLSSNVMVRVR